MSKEIDFEVPTEYKWITKDCLVVPAKIIPVGNAYILALAFKTEEEFEGLMMMLNYRVKMV